MHRTAPPPAPLAPATRAAPAAPPAGRWAALVVVLLTVAALGTAAVLDARVGTAHRAAAGLEPGWHAGLAGLALCLPGALLLRRLPRHPVAWVLGVTGAHWAVDGAASSWLAYATTREPALPGAALSFWIYQRLGAWLLLALPLVLLLYPEGRLPTGRWRVASLLSLGATVLLPLVLLIVPADAVQNAVGAPIPAPLAGLDLDLTSVPLPGAVWSPLLTVAYAAMPVSLVVPFAVVVRRYRTATGETRLRMRWLLWAAVVDVLVMLSTALLPSAWASVALLLAVGSTGTAVAVGVARPRLLEIDRLLSGTLLYGGLAATVVLVDLSVLALADVLLGEQLAERDAAMITLLAVMAVYGPLRQRLWRSIRQLVLGRRDDRYGIVAGLAEQLEHSDDPETQLIAVARTVAEAFRSPYVAVVVERTGGERLVAEHGTAPPAVQSLPISYRGEEVGRLVMARSRRRVALSARDERLLGDVVRQAAAAARTSYLARELQLSRERLVTAREEERRRLRRDLHDGLGPTLGAVGLRIDTARNLATSAPQEADRMLRQAREDVTAALAEVRRVVHDLRPPALDDIGLLEAVRQQADRLRPQGLTVEVHGGPGLDGLPAAVEVAAYRIASEALTNVARHASARSCRVRLTTEDAELLVEVADDGVGIAPGTPAGVGLVSLRERVAELGGRHRITCPGERGTLVRARLPIVGRAASEVADG